MSRNPSPAPSHPPHAQPHMFHQLSLTAPGATAKMKVKPYVAGITAGAEDVKYQAKYKELKKKVKEIESDNDRLYLKLLLAKKNIRRMNLERAILYERLAQVPPTPGRNPQELPQENDPVFIQQQPQPQGPPEHPRTIESDERSLEDYLRSNPNARVIHGHDGRIVAIEDPSAHANDALGLSGPPPPHGIPIIRRLEPGHAHETDRPLPPPIPAIREPQPPPRDPIRDTSDRSPVYHPADLPSRQSIPSSHYQAQPHGHRSRGSSSRHDLDLLPADHGRLDTLPPTHAPGHSRSSSLSGEGQSEPRSRRHDLHELAMPHGHLPMPHPRAEIPAPNLPTSPQTAHSPTHDRIHNHQRMGPGMHLHRQQERDPEVTRQLMRERELEKERERVREIEYHKRRAREDEELRQLVPLPWQREEAPLTGPGLSLARSRSDTPGSGGGGGGGGSSSHPDSSQPHERERRSYAAPRVANLLSNPRDAYYDPRDERMGHAVSHSRSYPPEYGPGGLESSRKRARHDMEVDDDYRGGEMRSPLEPGSGSRSVGSTDSYPRSHELRGSKRIHPDDSEEIGSRGYVSSVRDEKLMDHDD